MKTNRFFRMISWICIASLSALFLSGCGKEDPDSVEILPAPEGFEQEDEGAKADAGMDDTGEEDTIKDEDSDMNTQEGREPASGKVNDGDALKKAVNGFNWAYFDIQDQDGNLFYSPLSISEALSMVLYGAGKNTAQELKDVLGIEDIETFLSDISAFEKADHGLKNTLTVANSLWADKTFTEKGGIKKDFLSGIEEKMDARVSVVDFAKNSDKAAGEISDWVKEKTGGFIKDYASGADENTVLDVINAIYFNGKWENEFMKEDTFEEEFRGRNRTPADMMHLYDGYFRYLEKDGFIGVELPYKESSLAMDIMMPKDNADLNVGKDWAGLETDKKEEFLDELSASEPSDLKILAVPRFDMDITAKDLKGDLEKLGIRDVFDPAKADLSGIADRIYVSDIGHRAKIEIDEEGSRAAAVTEIEMAVTSAGPSSENRYFICDRPFVYVIKDSRTGVIIFTGLVNSLE